MDGHVPSEADPDLVAFLHGFGEDIPDLHSAQVRLGGAPLPSSGDPLAGHHLDAGLLDTLHPDSTLLWDGWPGQGLTPPRVSSEAFQQSFEQASQLTPGSAALASAFKGSQPLGTQPLLYHSPCVGQSDLSQAPKRTREAVAVDQLLQGPDVDTPSGRSDRTGPALTRSQSDEAGRLATAFDCFRQTFMEPGSSRPRTRRSTNSLRSLASITCKEEPGTADSPHSLHSAKRGRPSPSDTDAEQELDPFAGPHLALLPPRSRLGAPRRSVSVSNLSQPFGTLEQERQQGMQLVSELKGLVVGMDPWLKACLRDSLYRISSLSDVRLANAKAGQDQRGMAGAVDRLTASLLYRTSSAAQSGLSQHLTGPMAPQSNLPPGAAAPVALPGLSGLHEAVLAQARGQNLVQPSTPSVSGGGSSICFSGGLPCPLAPVRSLG